MRLRAYLIFPTAAVTFLAALFSLAAPAHAESVQWNTAVNATLAYDGGNQCNPALDNPNVAITYNVTATNAATGASVCGTSVPAGTEIKFQFVPHTWQDIYWFGTGYDFDSPYGDWSPGAQAPTTADEWCGPNTYINAFGTHSDILNVNMRNESHVPLRVEPPAQTVANTGSLSCGTPTADGSVTCTANAPGSVTPTFNFAGTFGHFYFAILWDSNWLRHPKWISGPLCQPTRESFTGGNIEPLRIVTGAGATCKDASQIFTLQVPQQTISCPITVIAADGKPPATPTLISSGDSWSGLLSPVGGQVSKPITEETTYTLTCLDLNGGTNIKQATVRIIPTFQEQ